MFLVNCTAVWSTDHILVHMTSTAMGSIATYQCKEDVHTTQCTSTGWDPHPLSHLDCTKPTPQFTTDVRPTDPYLCNSTESTKPGWDKHLQAVYMAPFMHTHTLLLLWC